MSETHTPDNLIAGDFPLITIAVIIVLGQTLSRGAVLGTITASDKETLCDTGAADGSEAPLYILAEDVDASAADVTAIAYDTGQFNEDQLSFGGTDDADDVRAALRARSIFLSKPAA